MIPLREDSSKPSLVRRFLNYFTSKAPEDEALPTAEQVHQNAAKATPAKPKSLPSTTTSSTDTKINNGSDKRPPLEAKPQTIYPIKGPHQGITQSDLPSRVQLAISEAIPAVEAILHYKFSDPLLLWEALQEEKNGLFTTERRHFPEGNLMLALVGDKLLSSACSLIWYGSGSPRGESLVYELHLRICSEHRRTQMYGKDDKVLTFTNRCVRQHLPIPLRPQHRPSSARQESWNR